MSLATFSEQQVLVLREAVEHYGRRAQILKVAEELMELAEECILAANGVSNQNNIVDERADVAVVLYQFDKLLLPSLETAVRVRIGEKVQRLKRRMDDERGRQD